MENIFEEVNNYVRAITISNQDDRVLFPKKIELIVNRYLVDNNLPVVLDETLLSHYYSMFNRANYQHEMVKGIIPRNKSKTIISDIAMLTKLS